MPTRNIDLTDHLDRFIDQNVQSGRYQNASEVIRASLRLLEHFENREQIKLDHLQQITHDAFRELDAKKSNTYSEESLNNFFTNLDQTIR